MPQLPPCRLDTDRCITCEKIKYAVTVIKSELQLLQQNQGLSLQEGCFLHADLIL